MAKQSQNQGRAWYVLHTYSGYEDNVARNLRQRAESMGMKDKIFDVLVPKEQKIKIKNGKRFTVEERIFPGYVLVEMDMTDEAWHLVKNTPKVTGFLGGNKPRPMSQAEAERIQKQVQEGIERPKPSIIFEVGEQVRVSEGPFTSFNGVVEDVDEEKARLKVSVSIFGRSTPVELEYSQVEKL